MAWTYSGNPASSNKDSVRFLVGDTITSDPLATDEEIEWALGVVPDVYNAAALIASGIATNFARLQTSVKIGPISEDYSKRAEAYAKRAVQLAGLASSNSTITPYAGGISASDKLTLDEDNATMFRTGITDNDGTLTPIDPLSET